MPLFHRPSTGDTRNVPVELEAKYDADPAWDRTTDPTVDAAELKGAALDKALKDAGLSTSGSADEKRARLAEHTDNDEEHQA